MRMSRVISKYFSFRRKYRQCCAHQCVNVDGSPEVIGNVNTDLFQLYPVDAMPNHPMLPIVYNLLLCFNVFQGQVVV